jgi:peptidyl-prolyl cis-trans isomerase B (cyclophilin B)
VPSNKRQRELARARAERQAARRAAERAARRKRRIVVTLAALGTALAVVALVLVVKSVRGKTTAIDCKVQAAAEQSGGKTPGLPPKPDFGDTKTLTGNLVLNKGPIEITMFADKAPCTVNSFKHLASKKFFDGTKCHRQTNTPGLIVLQCGDPTATGTGGPGYQFVNENVPAADPATQQAAYPRGTVAMANSGADTNGSQFFLVMRDSQLPPGYTIFGQVTKGMEVLDAIDKAGIKGKQPDGEPASDVTITTFTVG